jgi:3-oxoacyl-[acyl-carrier protein] reductase
MNKDGGALTGKVAVITGAGRGIGRAIALSYGHEGAAICCVSRTLSEISAAAKEISDSGGQAIAIEADVSDCSSVESMYAQTADQLGGIDIVVINAGINLDRRSVEDSIVADWQKTLQTNLFGAYYCAKGVIPYMKKRGGGKIITLGSGIGHRGHKARSAYAASKAGLWSLVTVLAQELWPDNISVNELIPGPVHSALTKDAEIQGSGVFTIDSEWAKKPDDVVPLALFLATQPDTGPTGQSFSLMRRPR